MTDEIILTCTKSEPLPRGTFVYQTDDGTIFYREWGSPTRLYVNWNGKEVVATLPSRKISYEGVHGDAIYFITDQEQICEAVFTPKEVIEIYYLRDRMQDEVVYARGMCSRVIDGKTFVYRMSDVVYNCGIHVDIPDKELKEAQLIGIHRGIVIYAKSKDGLEQPEISAWSTNVLVIELPDLLMSCMNILQIKVHAQDSSPFIYFTVDSRQIYAFDTETMELLPPLRIPNVKIEAIVGIRDDEIMVKARSECNYLMTAKLPKRYAYI